jgi:CHAT domain-containing protein/uncharacterized UPF0146 family protein
MHRDRAFSQLVLALMLAMPISALAIAAQTSTTQNAVAQTVDGRKAEGDRATLEDAKRLLEQGNKQLDAKEFQAALQSFQQALGIYQTLKNRSGEGQAYRGLGRAARELKQFDQAIAYHQKTLEIAREIGDRELELKALNNFTLSYTEQGNNTKVVEFAQLASTLARELRQRLDEGWAVAYLAYAYASLNESQKAIETGQQTLVIAKELKNSGIELLALDALTRAYASLENSQKTVEFAGQALAVAQQVKNRLFEGRALAWLAYAYASLNENKKAIETGQQTLVIAKELKNSGIELLALDALSRAYASLENSQKTVEFAGRALAVSQQAKNRFFEGRALVFLANAYADLKENQKAIKTGQQALVIAKELKNPLIEVASLAALMTAYSSLSNPQKTIEFSQQGLALSRQLKNQFFEDRALSSLETLFSSLLQAKQYQNAIAAAQKLLDSARQSNHLEDQILALAWLARAHAGNGNAQMANRLVQQAEAIARPLKPVKAQLSALLKVQTAYDLIGDAKKAESLAQEVAALASQTNDPEVIKSVEEELLSYRFRQSGNLTNVMEPVLDLRLGLKPSPALTPEAAKQLWAENGMYLGLYVLFSEDLSKMESYLEQYWAAVHPTKDKDLELGALLIQAMVEWKKAEPKNLEDTTDLFLSKVREQQDFRWTLMGFWAASLLFYPEAGNDQKTIAASEELLILLASAQSSDPFIEPLLQGKDIQTSVPITLATSYARLNDPSKAIALLKQNITSLDQALTQEKQSEQQNTLYTNKLETLNLLADSYRLLGQEEKAVQAYRDALELSLQSRKISQKEYILATSYVGLAKIYQQRNMPITAITYYKQAVSTLEQYFVISSQDFNIGGATLSNLALSNMSNWLKEFVLKRSYFQDVGRTKVVDMYRELADLLLSQGRILEAQQVLELLKTQEVQDFTRSNKTEAGAEVPQTPTEGRISTKSDSLIAFGQKVDECEQKTCAHLKQLLDQRDGLVQQFDSEVQAIEKEFRDRNIRNIDDAALAPKDFLGQAQEIVNAQPGTVLIYPLVMDNRIWLLWASKGGIVKRQEVKGVGQKQLGETVLKFRQLLQNPNSDLKELKATGKQLYNWLLQPIEAELKANKIQNLVFSLDRSSRYIPMSALFDGEKYLIERYTVSTILSAGYTDMSQRPPLTAQNTKVMAFGLSVAKPGFNPLPNVSTELDAIVQQDQQDQQGIYPGQELLNDLFTADTLRQTLQNYRVLHIATHGKFVPVNPDKSFLLLGDGNQLEIPRIRTMQNLRNIDLVVLSACETALGGADRDGVEIAGISSYFLRKGAAKAVMASLWLVNDASTALMMQQFYTHLAKGMTKAEALKTVQQNFIDGKFTAKDAPKRSDIVVTAVNGNRQPQSRSFTHPYYWAPFILIGNGL